MSRSDTRNSFGFPVCPCCERPALDVKERRKHTYYEEDACNLMTSCGRCYDVAWEYYAERWAEYWQSVL